MLAVDEVDVLKHLRRSSSRRRSTGWALSPSLSLSLSISRLGFSHILQNVAPVMELYCALMRQKQQFPWAPAGRRLFVALELRKVRLLHPLPPASRRKAAVVERTSGSGRRECSEEQTPPRPSRLVCAELQGRLKVTDAMTCYQDSLLGLPTSWTGGQENRR